MGLLCGGAGRLTAENGDSRPGQWRADFTGGELCEDPLNQRHASAWVAMGEYVVKRRFQSNRAQRYIRLHMSLSAFRLGLSLNDILAHG